MTPERVARLVRRWVRLYTRDLPAPVARRRVDEIEADLHDQIAHERAAGADDRRIARGLASRMLRGVAADLAWRGRRAKAARRHSTREEPMRPSGSVRRSALRIAVGVAAILSLPLVAMQLSDEVVWSPADFVLAGVLLATVGIVFELAAKKAGNVPLALAVAALGVAAGILGEADDAPGLVLLGLLLVSGALALLVRRARAQHGG